MADFFENDGTVSSDLSTDPVTTTSDFSDPYAGDGSGANYGNTTYNPDGSTTYVDPDGQTYTVNADGSITGGSGQDAWIYDPKTGESKYLSDALANSDGAATGAGSTKATGTVAPTTTPAKGTVTPPTAPAKPISAVTSWLNNTLGTNLTDAQISAMGIGAGALAGIGGLNKPNVPKVGYQGGIPELQANRNMMTAPPAGHVPGSGGINWGGDVTYSPKGAAPAVAATSVNPNPVLAAQGGLMGLAHGGRYLQGDTDGMADKLRTSIDGKQPAALSHGEFVVPADVVSHLGNGNSDAGAKKLYSMMDKIRQARTGTKKQGKQINPDKFMPGGLASAYAQGGEVRHFATGDSVPAGTTGVEQAPASWAGSYITNMLGQGQALANAPYQQYQGPLTAGSSGLQNQAFGAASNLQTPSTIGQAANTAGGIANAAQNMSYSPTSFTSQFNAPAAGAVTNFTNQYQAPTPYQNTNFTSGTFGNEQAQQYMNPYLQQSLNPQLTEARRQSDITAQQNNAAMTKAGAFGGGRQAILTSENQRNLGSNLANITGQGYNTAYTNAMSQYNQDQARNLQAQQATEASKQFGATQGMTAAQLMAQYGMSAQQAQEAARQFQQSQAMTGAQSAAQYGQAAQQAGEQSKQFGANLGLQGLQTGLQAAQAQGQLGTAQNQANLANISEQANLGATQRGITSEGIAADQAAFAAARDNPYKMVQFQQSLLNGLPISATNYTSAQPSGLASAAAGATTVNQLLTALGLGTAPAATTPGK